MLADAQIEGFAFREFKLDDIFNKAKNKSIDYAKRKWFAHDLFAQAKKNKIVAECLKQMIHFYSGWHFVEKNPVIHFNPPTWQLLKDIAVPSLIIYGEQDLPDFIEMCEGAATKIPRAKKVVLPDTGHLSNMENPVAFNKELQEFLESIPV